MADAFEHASGMAQSHAGGSVSGKYEADRYLPARPVTPKPSFDALYGERERVAIHRERKMHVGGGVTQVEYEIVEDRKRGVMVVSPYNASKNTQLVPTFLSLEKLYESVDGLEAKPWRKHADDASRDAALAKFIMSRMQLVPGARVAFVPRAGNAHDAELEVSPPPDFPIDAVFQRPLLLESEPPAPAPELPADPKQSCGVDQTAGHETTADNNVAPAPSTIAATKTAATPARSAARKPSKGATRKVVPSR